MSDRERRTFEPGLLDRVKSVELARAEHIMPIIKEDPREGATWGVDVNPDLFAACVAQAAAEDQWHELWPVLSWTSWQLGQIDALDPWEGAPWWTDLDRAETVPQAVFLLRLQGTYVCLRRRTNR